MPAAIESKSSDRRNLITLAWSLGGYFVFLFVVVWAIGAGIFVPGKLLTGDVRDVYAVAGDALRNGEPVYTYADPPYFYSPPWTVLFGAVSWLPVQITWGIVTALNVAALRYVAGSWRRLGYLLWIVPIPFELALGNVNLLMAAAMVAAVRSNRTALPAILTFAKFSPVLAVNPRQWRSFALWISIGILITVPWWWLWPQWFDQMQRAWQHPVGNLLPIPFLVRLPFALALVATRTRLGRVSGAVLATPAFYWLTFVMLAAPISILFDLHDEGRLRMPHRGKVPERGAAPST